MTLSQTQCYVELSSFSDLARHVCAFRDYPLRVYSHNYRNTRVVSSIMELTNTLMIFYVPIQKTGRYISYRVSSGKEHCDVVDSTKSISVHAPMINFESELSPLKTKSKNHEDQLYPVKVGDLGSLARLTYDPEYPDDQNFTLFTFQHKKSWILGHITTLDMGEIIYQFNYIELESEPLKPFIKYQGHKGGAPEFATTFRHGFFYLPIIKIKKEPAIFGMSQTSHSRTTN